MPMVKKSISITDQQDSWIKSQIATGHFGNESEIIRELIRERQIREQETPAEIVAIRGAARFQHGDQLPAFACAAGPGGNRLCPAGRRQARDEPGGGL